MKRTAVLTIVLLVGALLGLTACGGTSQLVIRHDDPSEPVIDILVDEESVGTLEYGNALYINLDRGYHIVLVRVAGTGQDHWSDEGRGWEVYVEDEVVLTLLEERPSR